MGDQSHGLPTLVVVGASGRMGQSVSRLALEDSAWRVVGAVGREHVGRDVGELVGSGYLGVPIVTALENVNCSTVSAVIDFSTPGLVPEVARWVVGRRAAYVTGTTGLDTQGVEALNAAARSVPVLWEPNMSVGIHVLSEVVRLAVGMLGKDADIEIVEAHHRYKVDSPSGTAIRLADVVAAERKRVQSEEVAFAYGRHGKPGARSRTEVGVHAIRGGDVIGDHTVHLLMDGERLELTHRASHRDLFAKGALKAASRLVGMAPGRYSLADILSSPNSAEGRVKDA